MRVALVTPGFSAHAQDWAIPALLNLARGLAARHNVHVFSQRYPARGVYKFEGLTHHAQGGGQKFGLASAKIWLETGRAIVRQHQTTPFDVLHAFWADEAGFSAALAGAIIKRPVIVSIGGGELTRLLDINYGAQRFLSRRLTTRLALKKASIVTAGSPYQLDLCQVHKIPEDKLHRASLGVDTALFRPTNYQLPITRPTLVQAASLVPVKNQTLLLQTLALVKKEIPNIYLNLIGSGPLQNKLNQLAHHLGLSQTITWHGQVQYAKMPGLYRQAHLYVQTSRHESQGMAVLEAMACGLPVLGTPVGVIKNLACKPAHVSAEVLAGQIVELLKDEAEYLQWRQKTRTIIEKEFGLPATTNKVLDIYATVL